MFSNKKDRRFLVIDVLQLILVEPDSKRLGWGVVRFVGFLQVCVILCIRVVKTASIF